MFQLRFIVTLMFLITITMIDLHRNTDKLITV